MNILCLDKDPDSIHGMSIRVLYAVVQRKYTNYRVNPRVQDAVQDTLLMMCTRPKPEGLKVVTWFLNNVWWKLNQSVSGDDRFAESLDQQLMYEESESRTDSTSDPEALVFEPVWYNNEELLQWAGGRLNSVQMNVLRLVLSGYKYNCISEVLQLSHQRVHQIAKSIRDKLSVY